MGFTDWIGLVYDRDHQMALVNAAINLRGIQYIISGSS
jgi:hypothetical protein